MTTTNSVMLKPLAPGTSGMVTDGPSAGAGAGGKYIGGKATAGTGGIPSAGAGFGGKNIGGKAMAGNIGGMPFAGAEPGVGLGGKMNGGIGGMDIGGMAEG